MGSNIKSAKRPLFDLVLKEIIDYVYDCNVTKSQLAMETARYCLMDSLGCAFLALNYSACTKLLGPIVPGAELAIGARVPGTAFQLEPVQAAFNIGTLVRWLDYNDTWLAAEWGHPSDNLGAILACADYVSRVRVSQGQAALTMRDVLALMIKAHEIQGILALENSFNREGLDHVLLVRIASTATAAFILGATREQALNALSNAWADGGALRTYRHAPNTGSRKSWAAGDACSRAVRLALMSLTDEMGYPSVLTAEKWGFQDVLMKTKSIKIAQPFATYVMENVLFKISFPAEFHAQTAVEAAVQLHAVVKDRIHEIEKIIIETQEPAVRIIDKVGPLNNPADRDHCLQYMTVVALLKGNLTAEDYEDEVAQDECIDRLRNLTQVVENPRFTREYLEADKRSIGNAVQVFFKDGSFTEKVSIDYPIGHRCRRAEGIPLLIEKFKANLARRFAGTASEKILAALSDQMKLEAMSVSDFMGLMTVLEK